ncbi:hypothetical protein [Streptomyces sp. YIM S03343]
MSNVLPTVVGIAVNCACCLLAYRLAPRKGADRRDWSFIALVMGPIGLLLMRQ